MSILPTWPIAAGALAIGLAVGAVGSYLWNADTIADLEVDIAEIKSKEAQDIANQYKTAFDNLEVATATIKTAAETGQVNYSTLASKLDTIDRRYRNAKPPAPLPVDCKPGAERVRRLTEGAAAVDQAILGSVSSK
jgi:hypothetical protein